MAKFLTILLSQIIIFPLIFSLAKVRVVAGESEEFIKSLAQNPLEFKKEKMTHFRVYWHDILSGVNRTTVPISMPPSNTSGFGMISMIDNPLTLSPKLSSKMVGRAQGFYAMASQEEIGLLMNMNFAITEGKYKGSTISILGRNTVFSKVREMPIIGGSGLFRFARGYVEARTYTFDFKTGDATVEYNVYVLHY